MGLQKSFKKGKIGAHKSPDNLKNRASINSLFNIRLQLPEGYR